MNFIKLTNNQKGETLVTVLFAVALVLTVAIASMQVAESLIKAQAVVKSEAKLESLVGEINSLFSDERNLCDPAAGGIAKAIAPYSGTEEYPVDSIKLPSKTIRGESYSESNVGEYTVGEWNIDDIRIKEFSGNGFSNSIQSAILEMKFSLKDTSGNKTGYPRIKRIPIAVRRDNNQIVECYSHEGYNKLEQERTEIAALIGELKNQVLRSIDSTNLCQSLAAGGLIEEKPIANNRANVKIKLNHVSSSTNVIIKDPSITDTDASSEILGWSIAGLYIGEMNATPYGAGALINFTEANLVIAVEKRAAGVDVTKPYASEIFRIPLLVEVSGNDLTKCHNNGSYGQGESVAANDVPLFYQRVCEKLGGTFNPNSATTKKCDGL